MFFLCTGEMFGHKHVGSSTHEFWPLVTFGSLVGKTTVWDGSLFDSLLLTNVSCKSHYAFMGDYVAIIDTPFDTQEFNWTLHPKVLMKTHSLWKGAPTGIKASAWIHRNADTSHVVLFTDRNMFIYRTKDSSIVYRSQVCV